MRVLNKELQKKAEKELNEKPDRIREDIQHIKEWIEKEPHLNARTDNQWLLSFLRGCKFSLQRTKEKIDSYYTMRTLLPEFFANRDPFLPEIQHILKQGVILPLPKAKEITGPRIVLFRWKNCDPDVITMVGLAKVYFMIMDILMMEDDNSMVAGKIVLADYRNFRVNYILQFTPSYLKKSITCFHGAYPIRIKGLYCYYAPAVFEKVFSMIKGFMTEKIRNRMALFSEANADKVYKYVPKSLLPKDHGGENGSIDNIAAEWKKKVESYKEWFQEDERYCTHEHLRYGKPYTTADIFGVEGTFRKLTID